MVKDKVVNKIPKIVEEQQITNPGYIALYSLLVLVFTILIFWIWSRRRQPRNKVLLMGLCDSGKTLAFSRLCYSQHCDTHTSIKENVEDYAGSNRNLQIVDIPGHERLRTKFFDDYKPSTLAIVYMVDSVNIQKDIRDVAEFLYNILTDKVIVRNSPSLLIACNKQDEPLAKGAEVIRALIEKELNLLRTTKSSQLESVDPSQSASATLGRDGKDFEFSQLSLPVGVAECNACSQDPEKGPDVSAIEEFLKKL